MLYVYARDVINVVFSVCIVTRGTVLVYGKYECFVMQLLYFCVLCASCGSTQSCILHDLQFVNAGRGLKIRLYRRGILQNRSPDCILRSHECLIMFIPSSCCECFYDL